MEWDVVGSRVSFIVGNGCFMFLLFWLPFVHVLCTHRKFPLYNTCFLLIKKKKNCG